MQIKITKLLKLTLSFNDKQKLLFKDKVKNPIINHRMIVNRKETAGKLKLLIDKE